MSVVNISSSRSIPEANVELLAQLAVALSRRLTRVLPEDMGPAITGALTEIAAAIEPDGCQLLEFGESGGLSRVHALPGSADASGPAAEAWLVERLTRGEVVDITRPDAERTSTLKSIVCGGCFAFSYTSVYSVMVSFGENSRDAVMGDGNLASSGLAAAGQMVTPSFAVDEVSAMPLMASRSFA